LTLASEHQALIATLRAELAAERAAGLATSAELKRELAKNGTLQARIDMLIHHFRAPNT
jgi:hypothetical protein